MNQDCGMIRKEEYWNMLRSFSKLKGYEGWLLAQMNWHVTALSGKEAKQQPNIVRVEKKYQTEEQEMETTENRHRSTGRYRRRRKKHLQRLLCREQMTVIYMKLRFFWSNLRKIFLTMLQDSQKRVGLTSRTNENNRRMQRQNIEKVCHNKIQPRFIKWMKKSRQFLLQTVRSKTI